jgi:hypothetical protein
MLPCGRFGLGGAASHLLASLFAARVRVYDQPYARDRRRQYPGRARSRILRRKAVRPRHSVAGLRSGRIVPLRPYARAMALGDATLVRDPELRDRIAHLPVASAGQLVSQEPAGATAARRRAAPVASAEASLGLRGRCAHVQKSSPIPGCPGGSTKKIVSRAKHPGFFLGSVLCVRRCVRTVRKGDVR